MIDTSVKVALVSGASRGIGEAIAVRLVREGFFVVGTATSSEGAQRIEKKLENGLGVVLDIRSRESTDNLLLTLKDKNISPAVLVNNAGITRDNLILRMSDEEWGDVLETNLNGVFRLTKGLVRGMTRARWGRIINISSVNGQAGQYGQVNYCAAKAGIIGMTKAIAQEGARYNITANTVAPGYVDTEMVAAVPQNVLDKIISTIPVGRLGHPQEIARAVAFLAREDSQFVTGSTISINGGHHMY